VTLAEPELEDGADDDELPVADEELLLPDELLVPDDELPPADFPEVEWADDDPALDPDDVPVVLAVLWAAPGRVNASPPATARPRTPVPAVTARSRPLARSRFTTAVTVRGSLLFIMSPSRKLTPLTSRNGLWLRFPHHLRRL
jgi:hypothetical protein